jgi:hypothetical protein
MPRRSARIAIDSATPYDPRRATFVIILSADTNLLAAADGVIPACPATHAAIVD